MPPAPDEEVLQKELIKRINPLHVMVSAESRQDFVKRFAELADKTKVPGDLARAEHLRWYLGITAPEYQDKVREYQKRIIDLLDEKLPDIDGDCDRKQKSVLAFDLKVLRRQIWNMRFPDDTRVERPSDVHGIRLILDGNCMRDTYRVARVIMDFFTCSEGHVIRESTGTVRTTKFDPNKYPDVVLPTEEDTNILKEYSGRYKDYNIRPKGNSYQALHFVVSIKSKNENGSDIEWPLEIIIYTETAFLRLNREMENPKNVREIPEDSDFETHYGYKNRQEGFIYAWMGQVPYIQLDGFEGKNYYNPMTGEYVDEVGLVHALCHRLSTGDQRLSFDWKVHIGH